MNIAFGKVVESYDSATFKYVASLFGDNVNGEYAIANEDAAAAMLTQGSYAVFKFIEGDQFASPVSIQEIADALEFMNCGAKLTNAKMLK